MSGTGPFTEACVEAARAPWDPARGAERARQMRLFRAFVPEVLIFRGHPALPFVVVTPLVAWCLERAAPEARDAPALTIALFAAGVLAWTLLEYLMHRFLFHFPARGDAGKVTTFIVHGHHHRHPDEPSRLAATPVQFVSLGLLMLGLYRLVAGVAWPTLMAGTMSGYLAYEAIHHLVHHGPRGGRVLEALRRHHMAHHHRDPRSRWGISSPLWDWVFGTAQGSSERS